MNGPTATVCRLTPPGRGAVATIQYRGSLEPLDAAGLFRARNGRRLQECAVDRLTYGVWGEHPGEDVVVVRTTETSLEIHCHGGTAAVARIMADLERLGAQSVDWQVACRAESSLVECECLDALTQAPTARTAVLLARLAQGRLETAYRELLALTEREDRDELRTRLSSLLRWRGFVASALSGWSVAIVGRPNVGKSSLLNALVGYERAIVYDEPGTTRDVIRAATAFDGWLVRFSDTAGMRETADEIESAGVERARKVIEESDLVLFVADASQPLEPTDRELLRVSHRGILVANKADLAAGDLAELREAGAVFVSALTKVGVPELIELMLKRLIPDVPADDEPLPVNQRQERWLAAARDALDATDFSQCRACLTELLEGETGSRID